MDSEVEEITGETCPVCMKKTLSLREEAVDVPYFGLTHVFSMNCSSCSYFVSDVEADEPTDAVKQRFTVESEKDLSARVIKSSSATLKIPRMVTIESGPESSGYISNVQGVLERFKAVLEDLRSDDDKSVAKKAKNQLKKVNKALAGHEKITIILEDPTGHSAIIESE